MFRAVRCSILAASVLLTACAGTPRSESTGEFIDSSAITTKVKANLLDQLGSKSLPIQVKTFKDEVQLSGFVNSLIIKQRAGAITMNTQDVRKVRNDLIVK